MNNSATLIQRDVIRENSRHAQLFEERMLKLHAFELAPFSNLDEWPTRFQREEHFQFRVAESFFRQQQFAGRSLNNNIFIIRVKRERAVCRQRPRSGGPN